MKKLIIMLLALLFTINIALAGSTKLLEDFKTYSIQTISFNEGDRLLLNLFNTQHSIVLDKANEDYIDLDIYRDLSKTPATPFYVTLSYNNYIKLDLNKDRSYEIIMKLNYLNNKSATVTLELINDTNAFTGYVISPPEKQKNTTGTLIVLLIIAIGIILYFTLNKKLSF